ncbi:MAG: DUF2971 domain-containing protein [Candidatus Thiodiazotropha sp.]
MYLNLSKKDYDKPVYRIITKERLIELFQKGKNTLVHPSKWDDPYENFILKSQVRMKSGEVKAFDFHDNIYGQCWSRHKASDAMWRIYSPNKDGIRIKSTIRKLLSSLYFGNVNKPSMSCVIGKVEYLTETKLNNYANSIYVNGALSKDNLFRSLLVKRRAFKHENEVRLLYFDLDYTNAGKLFSFGIKPHELIDQIMIDPRKTYSDFLMIKDEIKVKTGFSGAIKRSLLYKAPEELVLDDN